MSPETQNKLYGLLHEQVGEQVSAAMWRYWSRLSEEEAEDLYRLCMIEPTLSNALAKLYAAQLIAIRSGKQSDMQLAADRAEAVGDKFGAVAMQSDSYSVV